MRLFPRGRYASGFLRVALAASTLAVCACRPEAGRTCNRRKDEIFQTSTHNAKNQTINVNAATSVVKIDNLITYPKWRPRENRHDLWREKHQHWLVDPLGGMKGRDLDNKQFRLTKAAQHF